ncbi:hypothetical protein JXM67_05515 [candidate division WOR-3 bacterium]|nr:hypothetical protein [candidate division WOR-3 bacterium]
MIKIECPACGAMFSVSKKTKVKDKVRCPECGEALRIVSFKPLEVEFYSDERGFEMKYAEEIAESEEDLVKGLGISESDLYEEEDNYQGWFEGSREDDY